jgi:hypothetical protein
MMHPEAEQRSSLTTKRLTIGSAIVSLAVWASLAGPAQALMIAGWDFSQYYSDGILSVNGVNADGATALPANYSSLDPTNNAGSESASFGTLYFNGAFTSSTVIVDFSGAEAFVPSAVGLGSLQSNLYPFDGPGLNQFDSLTVLQSEGQTFQNLLSMKANEVVSVVFEADMTSDPQLGTSWNIRFGGQTSTGVGTVGVEYSTTGLGGSYASAGSVNLTDTDSLFAVPLLAGPSDLLYVRLTLDPQAATDARIDNVSINATAIPEPGTGLLLLGGLAGLVACRRLRA